MYRYSGLIVFVGALAFCLPRMHAGEPRAPYRTLSAKWKADREALNDSSQSSDDKAEEQIADLKARYTKLFVEGVTRDSRGASFERHGRNGC